MHPSHVNLETTFGLENFIAVSADHDEICEKTTDRIRLILYLILI